MTLKWFEKLPNMDAYRVGSHYAPYALLAREVRFTDAELAAEMYRAVAWIGANGKAHATGEGRNILLEAAFTFGPITRDEHEWLTMNRFATHPHYDEEN
jgi:hypothetical protein